ncbi:glyoxalase [Viridibacillus arvi]|uniref:glyoxalase n=1 Tax=Viridibacillus arvi TaxID=263475 RepID=UPI0036EE88BE
MIIQKVSLYSSNLEETKNFYVGKLGLGLLNESINSFEIAVGTSILEFKEYEGEDMPFYHFALNVPGNLFREAKTWIMQLVSLNNDEEGNDEVHFESAKAFSCYFEDPSGNIVELISRYGSSPQTKLNEPFLAKNLLNISEINVTTDDVLNVGSELQLYGIVLTDEEPLEPNALNFLGEREDGAFFLLAPTKRIWYFSTKEAVSYPLMIQLKDGRFVEVNEDGNVSIGTK